VVDADSTLDLRSASGSVRDEIAGGDRDERPSRSGRHPRRGGAQRAAAVAALLGVLVTALLSWAAWAAHDRNEDRLLQQRTREAAATLSSALPSIQTPLASAAELAWATDGDVAAFENFTARIAGEDKQFRAAALWSSADTAPIATVGSIALAGEPTDVIRRYLDQGMATPQLTVVDLLDRAEPRLGYLFPSTQQPGYLAYAESALPTNRTQSSRQGRAFENLDFAVYLGDSQDPVHLLLATTPNLPIRGRTAQEPVPFGDTAFLLVASPHGPLGGSLMASLPWIIAIAGLVMTALATLAIRRLIDRRSEAEDLSHQIEDLYDRQRTIAQTLQRSLLPDRLPQPDGLEVAARYEAGAQGMEIGGDWYDVVESNGGILVVIGDVSGRGLSAGATMAELRFSARAYAQEGHPPDAILTKLGNLLDVSVNGHFATVLCARIDTARRRVDLASAGHPGPVLVEGGRARLVPVHAGIPVGVRASAQYVATSVGVAPGATLLTFTDGLYERRGETVDAGLERVRRRIEEHAASRLDALLDHVVAAVVDGSDDDTAILGIRWQSPTA
jgi:serine phosphatase RsbU (regulator of sigma subunit)